MSTKPSASANTTYNTNISIPIPPTAQNLITTSNGTAHSSFEKQNEGKVPSQSDYMIYSFLRKGNSVQKKSGLIDELKIKETKKKLAAILEDAYKKLPITQNKGLHLEPSAGSRKSSLKGAQQILQDPKNFSERNAVDPAQNFLGMKLQTIEEGNRRNQDEGETKEDQIPSRKDYSVREDWTILEATDSLTNREGVKSGKRSCWGKEKKMVTDFAGKGKELEVHSKCLEETTLDTISGLSDRRLGLRQKDGGDVETLPIVSSSKKVEGTRENSKLKKFVRTSTSMPEEELGTKNLQDSPISSFLEEEKFGQQNKRSEGPNKRKKRGAAQYGGDIVTMKMKRVRLEDGYKAQDLAEDLMIYVDLSRRKRLFIKQEIEEEIPIQSKLKQLCQKHHLPSKQIVVIFENVSNDLGDLEKFLEERDTRMLWNAEEDKDLLEDDPIAIKYLKKIKGDASIMRRREYLKSTLKK